jgi:hypothetical protein
MLWNGRNRWLRYHQGIIDPLPFKMSGVVLDCSGLLAITSSKRISYSNATKEGWSRESRAVASIGVFGSQ